MECSADTVSMMKSNDFWAACERHQKPTNCVHYKSYWGYGPSLSNPSLSKLQKVEILAQHEINIWIFEVNLLMAASILGISLPVLQFEYLTSDASDYQRLRGLWTSIAFSLAPTPPTGDDSNGHLPWFHRGQDIRKHSEFLVGSRKSCKNQTSQVPTSDCSHIIS